MKFNRADIKRTVMLLVAAVIAGIAIKVFADAGGLFPGGASGIAILLQRIFRKYLGIPLPYSLFNIILNSIPFYIGFKYVGKKFTFFSAVMVVAYSVVTDLIPAFTLTDDILLISVFGGIVNGTAISLALVNGFTTGGTDIISIFLSKKKNFDAFNVILGMNVIILCIAGLMFGWDKALYSIIFQFTSTVVINRLYLKYQEVTLFIVTNQPQKVAKLIYDNSRHGATILDGKGSYEMQERQMVYSVISGSEARKIINLVSKEVPDAFINSVRTAQMHGRFYHKPEE